MEGPRHRRRGQPSNINLAPFTRLRYTGAMIAQRLTRFTVHHPDVVLLGALLLLGSMFRLAFLFRAPVFYVGGDSQTYLLPAYELVREGNWDLGFRRPPGYPLFLAATIGLFGEDTRAISFAQHMLGLGIIAASYALGVSAGNRAVGVLAGLSAAISGPLLVYEHYVMSETLFTLIVVLVGLTCLRLRDQRSVKLALLCGALIGAGWLVRPAALLLLPMVPLALLRSVSLRRAAALGGAVVAGLLIVAAPWAIVLSMQHGTASAVGLGNNLMWRITRNDTVLISPRDRFQPREDDRLAAARRYAFDQAARKELPDDIADGLERRFGLTELQADRLLAEVSMEVIRSKPALYAQTTAELALDLFVGTEQYLGGQGKEGGVDRFSNPQEKYQSWWNMKVRHIPQAPLPTEAAEFGRARAIADILQPYRLAGPLLVLSLFGVMAGITRPRYRAALILGTGVTVGIVGAAALSGSTPRFRYPYDPMIWVLVGIGGSALVDLARAALSRARVISSSSAHRRIPAT